MRYRRFGKTEMMLSQFSLGCMQFTGDSPEENAIRVIERAVELGVNHIETARGYGNSEERVGKALKRILKKVPREKLYITTKIGPSSDVDAFKQNWNICMHHLGLDYLDNLDFHCAGSLDQIQEAMTPKGCLGYVRKLQDEGVLRHFGFSTHGYPKGVMSLVNSGEFESINLHYYYFYQGLRHVVERAAELDMGIFIISPNNQGGRLWEPTPQLVEACKPLHPMNFNHMWLLAQPEVHTLSFGPKTPEQIEQNLICQDFGPDSPEMETFEAIRQRIDATYRKALPESFCTTCNACLPCPEEINIPGLLNWNNMTEAFGMETYTRGRYSRVGQGGAWVPGNKGTACTKCGDCLPRCPENLAIPELLWQTHQRLETGDVRPPMWKHDSDLLHRDVKQS